MKLMSKIKGLSNFKSIGDTSISDIAKKLI